MRPRPARRSRARDRVQRSRGARRHGKIAGVGKPSGRQACVARDDPLEQPMMPVARDEDDQEQCRKERAGNGPLRRLGGIEKGGRGETRLHRHDRAGPMQRCEDEPEQGADREPRHDFASDHRHERTGLDRRSWQLPAERGGEEGAREEGEPEPQSRIDVTFAESRQQQEGTPEPSEDEKDGKTFTDQKILQRHGRASAVAGATGGAVLTEARALRRSGRRGSR
jgi:hypothetical protein